MEVDLKISLQSLKNLFSFPFSDPRWQEKFLIGAGLSLAASIVPVVPMLPVLGYAARLMRSGARNDPPTPLPEWDNWNELFIDGLRLLGVWFLLSLPAAVVTFGGWAVYMLSFLGPALTASSHRYGQTVQPYGMLLGMGVFFLSLAVGSILWPLCMLVIPAAGAHVAVERRFAALFAIGDWWKPLRANLGGFLVTLFVLVGMYFVLLTGMQIFYMTVVLCFVLPFILLPGGFYILVIFARLAGQAYADGLGRPLDPPLRLPLPPSEPQPAESLRPAEGLDPAS